MKKGDVGEKGRGEGRTPSESANEDVLERAVFLFDHLPPPKRQMSIHGLVVKGVAGEGAKA